MIEIDNDRLLCAGDKIIVIVRLVDNQIIKQLEIDYYIEDIVRLNSNNQYALACHYNDDIQVI